MNLCSEALKIVSGLRPACTRTRSFHWLAVAILGMCLRPDTLGVTSIVRGLALAAANTSNLLWFYHSSAICPDALARCWAGLVFLVMPDILRFNGRSLLVTDGIKAPKSGRKMPGVKSLHQESDNNSKPKYIMGHSCQAVSVLAGPPANPVAVPLAARVHEGVVFLPGQGRGTLFDKLLALLDMLQIPGPFYLIADAYYACRKMKGWTLSLPGQEVVK